LSAAALARSAVLTALAGLCALAPSAAAQTSYCSPSGDLCTGIVRPGDEAVLRIATFAHRGRYRLCVTAPEGSQTCRRFRLRRISGDLYGSRVRWRRHFPDEGRGIYRVRWQQSGANLGPRLRFRVGPTMHVRPNTVRAGGRTRVFGSAGGCAPGNEMILLSEAFPRRNEFAGVPAVFTPVRTDGRYSKRVRIPRGRRPGEYQISARCGGGNLGIFRRLEVLAPQP
jgi:hypothetical protein